MINIQKLIIEPFVKELKSAYERTYGRMDPEIANIIEWTGHLALENISNCDALYHNVEHTIMVTLCGQEILRGKHLTEGGVRPKDWLHFMMACLCHDIGFVKGICRKDTWQYICHRCWWKDSKNSACGNGCGAHPLSC